MNLSPNDLFVITRGEEISSVTTAVASILGKQSDQPVPTLYSPKFDGAVLRALAVCDRLVAARVEAGNRALKGSVFSLDLSKNEVWPVDEAYLAAMNTGKPEDDPFSMFGLPPFMASAPFKTLKGV